MVFAVCMILGLLVTVYTGNLLFFFGCFVVHILIVFFWVKLTIHYLPEIAYDSKDPKDDITIYIRENGVYAPYLVLTNSYNDSGHCLLMREHLLDDIMEYDSGPYWNCAYAGGFVDSFLRKEFQSRIKRSLFQYIEGGNEYFGCYVRATKIDRYGDIREENIRRGIISLSYTEVSGDYSVSIKDGSLISYFDNKEKRIAYYSSGRCGGWFLRTPELHTSFIYVVRPDGSIGSASSSDADSYSVRPCLLLDQYTRYNIITLEGRKVYALKHDYDKKKRTYESR
jgi:hypothetical protein